MKSLMPSFETENQKTRPVVTLATMMHSATWSHLTIYISKRKNEITKFVPWSVD